MSDVQKMTRDELDALLDTALIAVRDIAAYVAVGEDKAEQTARVEKWVEARREICRAAPALIATIREVEAKDAEIARLRGLLGDVCSQAADNYRARNGRRISIQDDNGEKCSIVPDDVIFAARAALGDPA